MKVLITGSLGLIGFSLTQYYLNLGFEVIGIDNGYRKFFFGDEANTMTNLKKINNLNYIHYDFDIRNEYEYVNLLKNHSDINLIIHAAAQPSHDYARNNKIEDFEINAYATLKILENSKIHLKDFQFIYLSTNKVYGDIPNNFEYTENKTRFIPDENHPYKEGFTTDLSIDSSTHSFFGVSKTAADLLVQEFGRTYEIKTLCLRGGCLTGSNHMGVKAHGFLNYLVKSLALKKEYEIEGYKGKQVRDNIDAYDVAALTYEFFNNPGIGEVYNIGGGFNNSISIVEGINIIQKKLNQEFKITFQNERLGDHKWYITNLRPVKERFKNWEIQKNIETIIDEILGTTI